MTKDNKTKTAVTLTVKPNKDDSTIEFGVQDGVQTIYIMEEDKLSELITLFLGCAIGLDWDTQNILKNLDPVLEKAKLLSTSKTKNSSKGIH